jgi:hypothetical protein
MINTYQIRIHVNERLDKRLGRFLRQIVPDTPVMIRCS